MSSTPTSSSGRKPFPWELHKHQHHWRAADDEYEAGKMGMWLFLATEILLFSGFFCAYAVFRMLYPGNWASASHYYLTWWIGGMNTLVLLLSSWTMVMAIRAAQLAKTGQILFYLTITQLCAAFFLVVKIIWEYMPKIEKGELPGGFFNYAGSAGHAAADAPTPAIQEATTALATNPTIMNVAAKAGEHANFVPSDHDQIFLGIYWIATGTHGLHVLVGMFVIGWCMIRAARNDFGPKNFLFLENTGLYWHIVDLIWIFLFPMLYLV